MGNLEEENAVLRKQKRPVWQVQRENGVSVGLAVFFLLGSPL